MQRFHFLSDIEHVAQVAPGSAILKTAPTPYVFRVECPKRTYTCCCEQRQYGLLDQTAQQLLQSATTEAERREKERQDSLEIGGSSDDESKQKGSRKKKKKEFQAGNIQEQSKRVENLKGKDKYKYWTGNMPPACSHSLAIFQLHEPHSTLHWQIIVLEMYRRLLIV